MKDKSKDKVGTVAKTPPEAELESRIVEALNRAFPTIPRGQLEQQRRFTVRLGHQTHQFDSTATWSQSGRADIIIRYQDRPLALLEVKREGLMLCRADYEQAQSYANQLTPRPPLVVVTNGHETRVYDANTGNAWSRPDYDSIDIGKIFSHAAKISTADMRWATEALMGRETGVWVPIVRDSTATLIEEMTDAPGQTGQPFARDLLVPRRATTEVIKALQHGSRFVVIDGAPSVGKTSLLRELDSKTRHDDGFAVLMLRGGPGPGLFHSLSDLFSAELEWNLSESECRSWLRRMAKGSSGPALVIAIDGVEPNSAMATDVEQFARMNPGPQVRLVLTTDQPDLLMRASNRRTLTSLGRHSTRVEIGSLDPKEFEGAKRVLGTLNIFFDRGAEYSEDYRSIWAIRTLYDEVIRDPRYLSENFRIQLPAMLGTKLIKAARVTFGDQIEMLRGYRSLARDLLNVSAALPPELALTSARGFLVRYDFLSDVSREELGSLTAAGWTRLYRHQCGEDIVVPRASAAFLTELAHVVGQELESQSASDPFSAGVWLGKSLSGVYLGDLVGAQAIVGMAERTGGFCSGIIEGLLSLEPKSDPIEGGVFAIEISPEVFIDLKVEKGKAWPINRQGSRIGKVIDLGADDCNILGNTTSWLILGQLASLPSAVIDNENQRLDADLLLTIGTCPFPLLRHTNQDFGHQMHDFGHAGQILCGEYGLMEPITFAMAKLLSSQWPYTEGWIKSAVEIASFPLLSRINEALRSVRPEHMIWAKRMEDELIKPAIRSAFNS